MWLRCKKPLEYVGALGKYSKSPWIFPCAAHSDTPLKKTKLAPLQERKMIDRRRLWAKGGDGGSGCSSFRRSRHDRHGRPDGGNGGRGGDVILECSPALWDFGSLQHHLNAKRGGNGASKNKIGRRGDDKVVLVPVGTVIHLVEGDIPSVVEKGSSIALDPWEIPAGLEFSQSESGLQSISTDKTGMEDEKTVDVINEPSSSKTSTEKSAKGKKSTRVSANELLPPPSHLCSKSRVHSEEFNFRKEEAMSKWEALRTDGAYEVEWGEGMEEMVEEEQIQYSVAELTEPGQQVIVARGGDGGLGNISSSKASKDPNIRKHGIEKNNDLEIEECDDEESSSPSSGFPGSETVLILELKSIADVGFVGMPNAGKSTLLGALTRAKPVVGHYAFTTLRPNLGNLNYDDFSVTMADIPGLIRGAHENRGLGHDFLRHIERTKVLAYVVDLAAALDGRKGIPPWEQLRDLILELEFYREGLSDRPALIVANKIDEAGAEEVYEELRRRVPDVPIFPVCAVLEEGVPELKDGLRMLVSGAESYKLTLDRIDADYAFTDTEDTAECQWPKKSATPIF